MKNFRHSRSAITAAEKQKTTVFYDGSCPLCSREMSHYRKCQGADEVNWLDISQSKDQLDDYGIDYDSAMKRFHVLSADGTYHTGAFGFIHLWSRLKPYKALSALIKIFRLGALLDWFYKLFAQWRIQKK